APVVSIACSKRLAIARKSEERGFCLLTPREWKRAARAVQRLAVDIGATVAALPGTGSEEADESCCDSDDNMNGVRKETERGDPARDHDNDAEDQFARAASFLCRLRRSRVRTGMTTPRASDRASGHFVSAVSAKEQAGS